MQCKIHRFAFALLALALIGPVAWAADRHDEALEFFGEFGGAAPPIWTTTAISVTAVVPLDSALNVSVSTNVTVTFSIPVDPATVTPTSFRLLGPAGVPVAAQVSVSPTDLQATLDPTSALGFSQVFTVDLTSDVQSATGKPALPFTSQFATETTPPEETLPDNSEQAAPPPNAAQARTGTAVSPAGDLNADGIQDFIAGAPGLQVGSSVEAGAAVVYLGSSVASERIQPDIIFQGVSAHDRAGVSVAGNFDFNGDGIPDILIGAEQVNRTETDDPGCAAGAPCSNGTAYLIYFDPTDVIHYPNIGDPALIDFVDLSLVGGAIPGVVFTGTALGDQAGFAVAGGGRFDPGTGQDVALGAPGADPGTPPTDDAGAVYVIFDDGLLNGTIALDRVANGQADQIDGVIYQGAAPGDNLGFAVSFPGDVMGIVGDDLAMGAPGADTTPLLAPISPEGSLGNAGIVFIPEGGDQAVGIIESCKVGDSTTGSQVQGNQAGMQLGFAVSGAGDNMVDGEDDLLMGAPTYEALDEFNQPLANAGLVAQTSSKLLHGIIDSGMVGADPLMVPGAVGGVLYTGAGDGDQLGSAVAGVGDVTNDGFDDITLGAPFSDPFFMGNSVEDAGTVYEIDGTVPVDLNQGIIESCKVGESVAGTQLIGTEMGQNAGSSLALAGDLSDDGKIDFLVASPGLDGIDVDDDAGGVYMVLESQPDLPGTCGPDGCVVADLENGAQIAVPPGSLSTTIGLAVNGVVELAELPVPPPTGLTLLGAADFDPEAQPFGTPLPTVDVPIRPGLEGQFAGGESLDLWFFSEGMWVDSGVDGTVQTNPHYPDLLAVHATVSTSHFYAVFIVDADGDSFWDAIDSDPADGFVCADTDGDNCDDCSSGTYAPLNDGTDTDADGACDAGDDCTDADGDGVGNGNLGNAGCITSTTDSNDAVATLCADDDGDTCDDCSSGTYAPLNDGIDTDADGACDAGDDCTDADGDGVGNGNLGNAGCITSTTDSNDAVATLCADDDGDTCDDCSSGTYAPLNDGTDTDADGTCDASDDCTDADGDGVGNGNLRNTGCITSTTDSNDALATLCADDDGDTCDDCSSGTYAPLNDGTDTDADGACDAGDDCTDADGDGVGNGNLGNAGCVTSTTDSDDALATLCADDDTDTCDDCSSGTYAPLNDGTDTDGDGACDAGDPDDDNDGVADELDCAPVDSQLWATPGNVGDLSLQHGDEGTLVSWTAPTQPGTTLALLYDTISSGDATDFVNGAVCVETDGADTQSTDTDPLAPGEVAYYLARAENGCGDGSVGQGSDLEPRNAIGCP